MIHFQWIYDIKKTHTLFAKYAEDLVNMSMPRHPEVNKLFSEALVELSQRVYADLTQEHAENVSLIWLHVTYEYMRDNHQIYQKLSQQYSSLLATGQAKEATQAIKLILKELEPTDDKLKGFESCQKWLKDVKSVSTAVEFITSEDSLIWQHGENGKALVKDIQLLWHSTQVVYLLIDHLFYEETEIDEKLLSIVTKNCRFLWKRLESKKETDMENTFKWMTQVLKQCNTNACNIYLDGITHCEYCKQEFKDPAELQCGHIFCKSCLEEVNAKKCLKCQKDITELNSCDLGKRETIGKLSRFRRKCNSFFVEFLLKCCVNSKHKMPDQIINMLLEFVKRNTSTQQVKVCRRTTELSPFHECMEPSPAVQSLVLKILLRCGLDQMKPHLQRFIEEAVKSNEKNIDEFYFMVVRSTEDQIYTSESHESLITKATESLCFDQDVFQRNTSEVTYEDLHTIAKIRFGITVAASVIESLVLKKDADSHGLNKKDLLQILKEVIPKNLWIQTFLLHNLYKLIGSKIIELILQTDDFRWILPSDFQEKQEKYAVKCEMLMVYEEINDKTSFANPISNTRKDIDENQEMLILCTTLKAVKLHIYGDDSLISRIKKDLETDEKWKVPAQICDRMSEDRLKGVAQELSLHASSLALLVLHTALVAHLSTKPEMHLLRALCFHPSRAENWFLPTMPDLVHNTAEWEETAKSGKAWKCSCGEIFLIENCGRPYVVARCPRCESPVGGLYHKAEKGFTEVTEQDEKGHILGDPSKRRSLEDSERSLSGAAFNLARALIHASLLWGATEDSDAVKGIVRNPGWHVGKHLFDHLQKDIDLLAKATGRNAEEAEMTIHLFLKHIMESSSGKCGSVLLLCFTVRLVQRPMEHQGK
nr:E3 ubiquitin-protein ligase rnf213-alpha-like [Paramormyrops kingsleyae]